MNNTIDSKSISNVKPTDIKTNINIGYTKNMNAVTFSKSVDVRNTTDMKTTTS